MPRRDMEPRMGPKSGALKRVRTDAPITDNHMNYSLNSLKEGYIGEYIGDDYRAF